MKNKSLGYSLLSLGLILSLSGCSSSIGASAVYKMEKNRQIKPEKTASERLQEITSSEAETSMGEQDMGTEGKERAKYSNADLKLYNALAKSEGTITFSPYSLRNCIGLVYNGTNDTVKEMIDKEFGFGSKGLDYYNNYDKSLNMGNEYGVAVANKAYIRDENELNLELLNTSNVEKIDMGDSFKASEIMNKYISDNTKEKIQNLIEPDNITPDTSLVAINCLYFKQKWEQKEKDINWKSNGYITSFGDTTKDVKIAKEVGDLDVLRLKYDDCDYSMYIICDNYESDKKNVDDYLNNLSMEEYMDILDFSNYEGLKDYGEVFYNVPEFKMDCKFSLKKYMIENGYESILGPTAFEKLGDVSVSDILQGTYIDVNKEGTEAAAATAMIMKTNSVMLDDVKTKTILVDDTFHFAIKDDKTNEILFMGRVDDIK